MNSRINNLQSIFNDCLYEWRFLDQPSLQAKGASFVNSASVIASTGRASGRVLSLDRDTSDYVTFGDIEIPNNSDVSIEWVARLTVVDTAQAFISKSSDVAGVGFQCRTTGANAVVVRIEDGASNVASDTSTATLTLNQWYHFCITLNRSGNMALYIDGVADADINDDITSIGDLRTTTDLRIGILGDDANPMSGEFDVIRVWSRVLKPDEVLQLAATEGFGTGQSIFSLMSVTTGLWFPADIDYAGNIPDVSNNNNSFAAVNGISVENTSISAIRAHLALQFINSSSHYLNQVSQDAFNFGTRSFTVMAYAALDNKSTNQTFISKWDVDPDNTYELEYNSATDSFRFVVSSDGTAAQVIEALNHGSPAVNRHQFIWGWRDAINQQIEIQIDHGSQNTAAHAFSGIGTTSADLRIGDLASGGQGLDGRIVCVGLWSPMLTRLQRDLVMNKISRGDRL